MTPNWSKEGFKRITDAANRGRLTQKERFKKIKEEYYENPKLCPNCNSVIPYEKKGENKFCNKSCSASFNNKGVRRHGNPKIILSKEGKIIPKPLCKRCSKECAQNKSFFCSAKCHKEYEYLQRVSMWIEGTYETKSRNFFRRYLTETQGYECSCCNISEWNNKPIVLEVDHIDGNSENNRPENLRFICPNCHSQTDTYKARNIGKGRHYRRERYANGQSY
jgi:Zn finger protein HypA/HybF involved in hydrogenase expression